MPYAARRSYAGAAPACTLTNAITSADTSALLTGDVTNWNNTANGAFYMVIDPGLSTEEKVLVGSRSGSSLSSITRGVDGTTASSHNAGATCYPVFTAVDADEANKVASTLTTKGDLLVTTGSTLNRLAVGSDGQALVADAASTNGVKWATPTDTTKQPVATLTTKGDIYAATASATVTRLGVGSDRQNLVADSSAATGIKWQYEGELTLNAQTGTTYTLVLTDSAKFVTLSNASAITLTVPTNASVAFPIGTQVNIMQLGAGQVTISGAGVTLQSAGSKLKTSAQYAVATLLKIATDTWVAVGSLSA
jgi:hypothetical protein